MKFMIQAACGCSMGKVRRNNEDNLFFNGKCLPPDNTGMRNIDELEQQLNYGLCMAVFDGMGGENYGELASFAAANRMRELEQKPKDFFDLGKKHLEKMTDVLNRAVVAEKKRMLTSRMGTTMAALYFSSGNVYACNVGDSRIYLVRDNALFQMSLDHVSSQPQMEGRKAPLTQFLGIDPNELIIEPHICKKELIRGDKFLICSDGVTDMLSNFDITDILIRGDDPSCCIQELIDKALANGGKDNITAIVCTIR